MPRKVVLQLKNIPVLTSEITGLREVKILKIPQGPNRRTEKLIMLGFAARNDSLVLDRRLPR